MCPEGDHRRVSPRMQCDPRCHMALREFLGVCGTADSTRLSDGHRREHKDWMRSLSPMIGSISGCLSYMKGGAADSLSQSNFYAAFDPNYISSRVSELTPDIQNKCKSPFGCPLATQLSSADGV